MMEVNVNQHDYRKLPRSSGDGMETSQHSAIESGKHVHYKVKATQNSVDAVKMPVLNKIATIKKYGDALNSLHQGSLSCHSVPKESNSSASLTSSLSNDVFHDYAKRLGSENDVNERKSYLVERKAECLDLNVLIKDLEGRNRTLSAENETLKNKLNEQTKVNADLKKLLVASIGEDIGQRVEEMVVDKTKFDTTLTSLETQLEEVSEEVNRVSIECDVWRTKFLASRVEEMVVDKTKFDTTLTSLETQLEEVSEELNRVSIECDVWRTKFLASRMMTNGLTDIKTTLFMKYRNCQNALQKLLEEQSDIRQHLRATNRLLQGVHTATIDGIGRKNDCWEKAFQKISIIELAHVNNNLAEDICCSVNPTYFYKTVNINSSPEEEIIPVTYLTPAEQLACQVLKTDSDSTINMDIAMPKMPGQYIGNSYGSRFLTNNFRVTFDCCDRCSGPLHVI